ncbi:MAG: 50S ribosomal protein L2 [Nanoarchaeota archaeon]|nr:50S ribosomal protein L2 [Nanoarchaeota archaeon]
MAKTIISQARGHGSSTYRVRSKIFKYRIQYPRNLSGNGKVIKLISSGAHYAPIAKVQHSEGVFYIPAFNNMYQEQELKFETDEVKDGNILRLKNIPVKTKIYNIESRPNDGGRFIRTGGTSGIITRIVGNEVYVLLPSKKEKAFNPECRATIGTIAGHGRKEKPFVKAGRKFHLMRTKSKLWPRTSAIKVNAIDHPFGSGRGKVPKSKIAKRNAPPGAKVGHIRPRRTGRKKK